MHDYKIPKCSLYHIIRNNLNGNKNGEYDHSIIHKNLKPRKEEIEWIKNNTFPPKPPLTTTNLNRKMAEIFGIKDRRRDIKNIIKNEMKFSYKKGSSTTSVGGSNQTKFMQSVLASRILYQIYNSNYMISIDEASFK